MDSCLKHLLLIYITINTVSSRFIKEHLEHPSTMILGLESGQILRCQINDTQKCIELKSEDDYAVTALAVSGEFVYIGSESYSLQRCRLDHEAANKTCVTFHNTVSEINALSISGIYVYVGLSDGTILQCGLRKSETCSLFFSTDSSVHSLATSDDYIYAGLEYEMIRCSLDELEDCTTLYNATSAVSGLIIARNHIYSGFREGEVWRCDLEATNCSLIYTAESEIEPIDIFDDYLHMSLDSGDVLRCYLESNESCSTIVSRNESRILEIVSIYATSKLRKYFKGENKECVWQGIWGCPPYVNYYSIEDRVPLELHIKDNILYSSEGDIFDTTIGYGIDSFAEGTAIFAMDPTGRIYASKKQVIGLLHHSSLLAGNPVSAAGEITVVNGTIKAVNTCSGHYWPSVNLTRQIEKALLKNGYGKKVKTRYCLDSEVKMNSNAQRLFELFDLEQYINE